MKYFKDSNNGNIIRVNKSSGYDVLEIYRENKWKECEIDGGYAREYWLGEGNCCLFEIDEAELDAKIKHEE